MTQAEQETIVVVGATGFVGRHIVPHLERAGYAVRAVSRDGARRPEWGPAVIPMAGDVETGAGLDDAVRGADAVVHLVAIPREARGHTFEEVNVRGVERVLAAMRSGGVTRIVHLSAMGVTDDPALRYLSSKWRGERLVRDSEMDWVVLRPSLLFGPGDGFFNLIKVTLTWWSPGVVAIPGDGMTRFQPLSVEDLAFAVERSLADPDRRGTVYELGGPEFLTYTEIADAVMRVTGKRRLKLRMPMPLIRFITAITDRVLPIFPVSHDQILSMSRPNYTERESFETAFGRPARPFDISYLAGRG